MAPETLDAILDAVLDDTAIDLRALHLNWRGEPLQNPRFVDLLRLVRARGDHVPMHWHTNGTGITEEKAREIVDAMPESALVYVSIDGGSRAAHEQNRGPGTYEKSLNGLARLLAARGSRRTPAIGLYQLELGVPASAYDPAFIALARTVDTWVRVVPVQPRNGLEQVRRSRGRGVKTVAPQGPCFWAGNALAITPRGEAFVCLLSHDLRGGVGNVLTEPIGEILARAEAFRAQIAVEGRDRIAHCRGCQKSEGEAHAESVLPPRVHGSDNQHSK